MFGREALVDDHLAVPHQHEVVDDAVVAAAQLGHEVRDRRTVEAHVLGRRHGPHTRRVHAVGTPTDTARPQDDEGGDAAMEEWSRG